ncbi:MAG: flavin reductase family protein [Fuscovulum sp.]|nr:flavin reductase family protein [Fuscovulum sp.]
MFYRPEDGHPLPHDPFKAIVAPRPIGWISTRCAAGDNLAPYSFFNAIADDPAQVMFAGGRKDSIRAIEETGVFAVNIVAAAALQAMNETSRRHPRGRDEFLAAGVSKAECATIDCPRVADAPATLECRATRVLTLPGEGNLMVLGLVTGVHLRDDCLDDGRFDVTRFRPLSRLGYRDYAAVETVFELRRPDD